MQFIHVLATQPTLSITALAVLGLLVGSFLNVVIHRLPRMLEREWRAECCELLAQPDPQADAPVFNLVTPRSRCPGCGTMVAARDNLPLLSWLLLRGRCRHCAAPISSRYPLVEAAGGLLGGLAAWHFSQGAPADSALWLAQALLAAGLCWSLLTLALIDFDTQLLPDAINQPLLWVGLGASFFELFGPDLRDAVLGAMGGYGFLWCVYWGFKLLTGKEGMGYGDFKLLGALGAWLGWQVLPMLLVISAGVGAVIGIALLVSGRSSRDKPMPFGPYLAIAGIIGLFWREDIVGFLFAGTRL